MKWIYVFIAQNWQTPRNLRKNTQKALPGPLQTSKMELFATIINGVNCRGKLSILEIYVAPSCSSALISGSAMKNYSFFNGKLFLLWEKL